MMLITLTKNSLTKYTPTIRQLCFCGKYDEFSSKKEGLCSLYNHPMYVCYYKLNNTEKISENTNNIVEKEKYTDYIKEFWTSKK